MAVDTCDMVLCLCSHRDSCQRGWRLLYIVAAYHGCSEVLQPHLLHFLQDVSQTPGLPFQGEGPTASGDPPTPAASRRVLRHRLLNICRGPTGPMRWAI